MAKKAVKKGRAVSAEAKRLAKELKVGGVMTTGGLDAVEALEILRKSEKLQKELKALTER